MLSLPLSFSRFLVLGLGLAVLSACTTAQWENPDVPETEWSSAQRYCQQAANRETEREARRTAPLRESRSRLDQGAFDRQMNSFSARRLGRQVFERCMTDQGYVKVTRGRE